jgi:chemotaxis family two-component system response regulator Rcp1
MLLQVLMIDDNPGDLQLIEAAFGDCRIPVSFLGVADPALAIAHLDLARKTQTALPHLIICDLAVLKMTGDEVVRAMKDSVTTEDIPLIVFSGNATDSVSADCKAAGATEVREKPTSYKGYLSFVQSLNVYQPKRPSRSEAKAKSSRGTLIAQEAAALSNSRNLASTDTP